MSPREGVGQSSDARLDSNHEEIAGLSLFNQRSSEVTASFQNSSIHPNVNSFTSASSINNVRSGAGAEINTNTNNNSGVSSINTGNNLPAQARSSIESVTSSQFVASCLSNHENIPLSKVVS